MNIAITGASGFIGKNLILRLKNKNIKIFSLSKKLNYSLFKRKNIKQISCDITKIKDMSNLNSFCDHLVLF